MHIFLFYEDLLKYCLIVIKRFETFNGIKNFRYNNIAFLKERLNKNKNKFVKTRL